MAGIWDYMQAQYPQGLLDVGQLGAQFPQMQPATYQPPQYGNGLLGRVAGGIDKVLNKFGTMAYPGQSADPYEAAAARRQALMTFGMGLLSGEPLARSYVGGLQSGGDTLEQRRREALMAQATEDRRVRTEEMQRKAEHDARLRAALSQVPFDAANPQGYATGIAGAAAPLDAGLALEALKAGQGFAPKQQDLPEGMMYQNGQIVPVPGYLELKSQIAAAGRAPGASVSVQLPPMQNSFDKATGEEFAKTYGELNKGSMSARSKLAQLDQLEQLVQGVETGKLAPSIAKVAALGESFGIKVDPTLGAKQAIESISNAFALQMRNPAGGAGMPGALSDKDREFLQNIVPNLAKTPEGNRIIIQSMKRLAQREVDVGKLANKYVKEHGILDAGFYDALDQYSRANPLFTGIAPATGGTKRFRYNPQTGQLE